MNKEKSDRVLPDHVFSTGSNACEADCMVRYSNTHSIACKITTTNKKVKHGYQAKGYPLHAIGAHRVVGEQCPDDFNLFGAVMQHTRVLSVWLQRKERALGGIIFSL